MVIGGAGSLLHSEIKKPPLGGGLIFSSRLWPDLLWILCPIINDDNIVGLIDAVNFTDAVHAYCLIDPQYATR